MFMDVNLMYLILSLCIGDYISLVMLDLDKCHGT